MLPLRYVDEIHARLQVRYGAKWLNLWAGVDPSLVKSDWCEQLSGLDGRAIAYGLANLPADAPPNVAQFRTLCLRRPDLAPPALPAPKADPQRVAAAVSRVTRGPRNQNGIAWAYAMQEREKRGEPLSPAQRAMYRAALVTPATGDVMSEFRPVDAEALPPAMRGAE